MRSVFFGVGVAALGMALLAASPGKLEFFPDYIGAVLVGYGCAIAGLPTRLRR